MAWISAQVPSEELESRHRWGIGKLIIILFCLGMLLEVGSSVLCHMKNEDTNQDELLSLLSVAVVSCGAMIFVRRVVGLRAAMFLLIGAAGLLLFSKSLDVLNSTRFILREFPIVRRESDLFKVLRDLTFTAGSLLVLLSFIASAIRLYQTQQLLARQNDALRSETQERQLLATAIEQAAEAVFITNREGIIQYVNPAFERLTGYVKHEAVGNTPRILKSGKHDARFYRRLRDTLARGDVWHGRFINRRKNGSLYEEDAVISCVRNEKGEVTSYIAVKHDVTAQVNLEKRLRQAQRMEVIGAFAGRISHDFNNILALILGHSEIALRQMPETDASRINVQHIAKAGNRASHLVKQLLTFSRQAEQERRPILMHIVVQEVIESLKAALPPTIQLRQVVRDCGFVLADPTQIHQVVMNLCTNACQASEEPDSVVDVSLSQVQLGGDFVADVGQPAPGAYVRLSVRDNGRGIDAVALPRIFDPFFTTKKQGEGTGLGLSTVHGIVTSYDGAITVRTVEGHGTTFDVYFPQMEGVDARQEPAADSLVEGSGRILFVEDDEEIAEMCQVTLQQIGYEVSAFTRSAEALSAFRTHPHDFDLVITDQVMPEMTGAEFVRHVLRVRPDVPIVMVTGFGEGITLEQARAFGIREYLLKPVSTHALSVAIRRALDGVDYANT